MLFEGVNNTIMFSVISIIYMIFFGVTFIMKEKIKSKELNIFKTIIIINIISLLTECSLVYLMKSENIALSIALKLFNVCIFSYIFTITIYTYSFTKVRINIKRKLILFVLYMLCSILLLILPVEFNNVKYLQYSYGPSVNFLFISISLMVTLMLINIFIHYNKENKKKYIPIIILILLLGCNVVVQYLYPNILLANSIISLVTFIMYFTIENPDVKILNEFVEQKKFAEKSNNEKTMFLYDLSLKLKLPINNILNKSENIIKEENRNYNVEDANVIKENSKRMIRIIDNILDISDLEKYDFKLVNTSYDIKMMLREIEMLSNKKMAHKDIDFRFNVSESLPKTLYGDSIRLKQIINIVMNNAINYTNKGFIEFNIYSVIKHDICRLIITVEDSGIGMTNDEIEAIFDKDKLIDEKSIKTIKIDTEKDNLAVANSLAKIIGGTIMVSSELGRGSIFTIVLDQKIANEQNETSKKVEEYTSQIHEKEKIMVVGYNSDDIKRMTKNIPYTIEYGNLGIDCLNNIRDGKNYKLIIMKEQMEKLDGITVFNKLKEIENFDIPVVIVGKEKDKKVINKYKENGLKEYINEPLTKEKVDNILNSIK